MSKKWKLMGQVRKLIQVKVIYSLTLIADLLYSGIYVFVVLISYCRPLNLLYEALPVSSLFTPMVSSLSS